MRHPHRSRGGGLRTTSPLGEMEAQGGEKTSPKTHRRLGLQAHFFIHLPPSSLNDFLSPYYVPALRAQDLVCVHRELTAL